MKKSILILVLVAAMGFCATGQTYSYKYTVKNNGQTEYKSDKNGNISLKLSADKQSCTYNNKKYNYYGRRDGFYVFQRRNMAGYRDGTYGQITDWLVFSSDFMEVSVGQSGFHRFQGMETERMNENIFQNALQSSMQLMQSMMGVDLGANKPVDILDVYKADPVADMRRKYSYVTKISGTDYYFIGNNDKYGFADALGNTLVSPRYSDIKHRDNYYYVTLGNKVGVLNSSLREVVPPKYNDIESCGSGYRVTLNGKVGLLNSNFAQVVAPKYGSIVSEGSGYRVTLNGKTGYIDANYSEVVPPKYSNLAKSGPGYVVTENGKKGILNSSMREVVSPQYSSVDYDGNGYLVGIGGKVGYVNSQYRQVISPKYTSIAVDGTKGFYVADGNLKGYCDADGREVLAPRACDKLMRNEDGFLVTTHDGYMSLYGNSGQEIVATGRYNRIEKDAMDGYKVYKGQYVGYIDASGNELLAPDRYTSVERNVFGYKVKYNSNVGYCDARGREVIPVQFKSVERDREGGYIVTSFNDQKGYYDRDGKKVVDLQYASITRDGIDGFYVGHIGPNRTATTGYVDANGKVIVPTGHYSAVERQPDGSFQVKKGYNVGYVASNGKVLVPPKYSSVKKYGNGFKVMSDGLEGWYNSKGRLVRPPWRYMYLEGTYGYGLGDETNHYLGLQYTNVRRMLGWNVALTGGLTAESLSLMAGPTLRLTRSDNSLQLYANVGATYGFGSDDPVSLAAGAGLRYGFNLGNMERFDAFSLTLGAQYLNSQWVPTVGVGIVPVGMGLAAVGRGIGSFASGFADLVAASDSEFPTHFSEMLLGLGLAMEEVYIGANYTFLYNRIGFYVSGMIGVMEGTPCFNVGPAFRLTDSDYRDFDFQLYQGFGMLGDGFGGETGMRFGFSEGTRFGKYSMSLGFNYGADHTAITFGFSWMIIAFPFIGLYMPWLYF